MKWIYTCLLLFIYHLPLIGQVSIVSSNKTIYIGEQFTINYTVKRSLRSPFIQFPNFQDSIPHLELISMGKIDSLRQGDMIIYSQDLIYTSFDSGRWVIPAQRFLVGNKRVLADTLQISVLPVKLKAKGYHDVHEILNVPTSNEEWPKWFSIASIVVIAAFLLLWFFKRKKQIDLIKEPIDPYKQAIQSLDKLKKTKSDIDSFYTGLFSIYRNYLSGRYKQNLESFTSDELIDFLKHTHPTIDWSELTAVLHVADGVKFARYPSNKEEALKGFDTIRRSIDQLHKTESH